MWITGIGGSDYLFLAPEPFTWTGGPLLRLSIGLEPADALWADLESALAGT